MKKIIKAQVL